MARCEQFVRLTVDHSAGARWVWIWAPDIDRVDEYTKPGSSGARAVVHMRLDKLYVQETPEMVLQMTQAVPQPASRAASANRCGDKVFATPDALVADWLRERGQKAVPKSAKLREDITGREVYLAWQQGVSYAPDWDGVSPAARSLWAEAARWLRCGGGASAIPTPAGSEVDRAAHAARVAFYEDETAADAWERVHDSSKATWRRVARAVLGARP